MLLCERCSRHRDNVLESKSMAGKDIEVPFDQNDLLLLPNCFFRKVQTIESDRLIIQRRLCRIDVLRIVIAKCSPSKTNDLPIAIADGKHETIAEPIVDLPLRKILLDTETGIHNLFAGKAFF